MLNSLNDPRAVALASAFPGCPVEINPYDPWRFTVDGNAEYRVLTDDEATDETEMKIHESLWSFNVDFLARYVPALANPRAAKAWEDMLGALCEDANGLVAALVGDRLGEMITDAIRADGRGHFLAHYDGEEIEIGNYRIYRVW